MDIFDVINGGSEYVRRNKPRSPDMDRISEIVLAMKAITSEAKSFAEHQAKWNEHITRFVDFDAIAWQAMNVAYDIMGISTSEDFLRMRENEQRYGQFIGTVQAVFDGFLLGAEFTAKGGHRPS